MTLVKKILNALKSVLIQFKKNTHSSNKNRVNKKVTHTFSNEQSRKLRTLLNNVITTIPESNGSKTLTRFDINLGIISDEFMFECYKSFANLFYLTPTNFEEILNKQALQAVLLMGTWHGINNVWQGCSTNKPAIVKIIEKLVSQCKAKNIPVIFQTIEDPVHYNSFLWLAKLSDVIITSAEEIINRYRIDCNHKKVYAVEFGINPLIHNPIGQNIHDDLKDTILFAGSWNNKRQDRVDDLTIIFDGVLNSNKNLLIIDRNSDKKLPNFYFPAQYKPYLTKKLDYKEVQQCVKLFEWCISMNTVTKSYTMFAMRGYELQACGNLILSNFNAGIAQKFPNIYIAHDKESIARILNSLTDPEIRWLRNTGIRNVMREHTYSQRLSFILDKVGIATESSKPLTIAVILEKDTEQLKQMFFKQSYPHKDFFIKTLPIDKFSNYDLIAFFGANHNYGVFYLEDMISAFVYTDSDFVTKRVYLNDGLFGNQLSREGVEYDYIHNHNPVNFRTIYFRKSYQYEELFNSGNTAGHKTQKGFSSDSANYCSRLSLENATPQSYKFTVVIPVCNNFKVLLRLLLSLKLERYFADIEILIIDYGSSDGLTPHVIKEYQQLYKNITTYFYESSAKASIMKAMNFGIEIAKSDFIAFLDPNDAVTGLHSQLYDELAKQNSLDFVYGYSYKATHDVFPQHKHLNSKMLNNKPWLFYITHHFKPYDVASAMYRRPFLLENNLRFTLEGISENVLFISETYFKANKVLYLNEAVVFHYTKASTTSYLENTHEFAQHLETEKRIKALFTQSHLYHLFLKKRHSFFIENCYFMKYAQSKNKENLTIKNHLKKILEIHDEIYDDLSETGKAIYSRIMRSDSEGIKPVFQLKEKSQHVTSYIEEKTII